MSASFFDLIFFLVGVGSSRFLFAGLFFGVVSFSSFSVSVAFSFFFLGLFCSRFFLAFSLTSLGLSSSSPAFVFLGLSFAFLGLFVFSLSSFSSWPCFSAISFFNLLASFDLPSSFFFLFFFLPSSTISSSFAMSCVTRARNWRFSSCVRRRAVRAMHTEPRIVPFWMVPSASSSKLSPSSLSSLN